MLQASGLSIGIVADDLTGANDVALPFFAVGCDTQVVFDTEALLQWKNPPVGVQVWSVNTQSRHLAAQDAATQVRYVTRHLQDVMGVDVFYKKIDSTLRGSVGAECLSMLDTLGYDCAVIAPAYPQYRRRTVGGYVLVEGVPVEQTPVGRDPRFPVRHSHLPTLLQQQVSKPEWVGHITLSTILHGAGPIYTAIAEQINQGKRLIVADACSDTDMEQIALAIQTGRRKALQILPCGAAGLAKALSRFWQTHTDAAPLPADNKPYAGTLFSHLPLPPVATHTLIVAGSVTEVCRKQLQTLEITQPHVVHIALSPESLLGITPIESAIAQVLSAFEHSTTVIISSGVTPGAYQQTMSMADTCGIALPADQVELTLAQLASTVLKVTPANLIMTGGETAYQVTKAINLSHWQLCHEIEPSIAIGFNGHQWMGIKPGNFGSNNAFHHLVRWFDKHQ
jgi:D-threonate/D-erythronate kinase